MIQVKPNQNTREAVKTPTQRILVALDQDNTHAVVFQKAQELAQALNGQLMLCHCLAALPAESTTMMDTASIGVYSAPYTHQLLDQSQALMAEKRQETLNWLQGLQEQLTTLGLTVEFDTRVGESGRYICDLAESWQADLVIMGRRGRSGLTEMLMGSVSNYVLHHAPCSVLVVQ
ncbi:MAG: universal stress protein [Spirulinaceae cyanobacterium]